MRTPGVNSDQAISYTIARLQREISRGSSTPDVRRGSIFYFSRARAARMVCNSFFLLCVDLRVSEIKPLHRFDNGGGDDEAGKPLLSAGTTYHGACFDAVPRIASWNARI
jgi:hypothetical protein